VSNYDNGTQGVRGLSLNTPPSLAQGYNAAAGGGGGGPTKSQNELLSIISALRGNGGGGMGGGMGGSYMQGIASIGNALNTSHQNVENTLSNLQNNREMYRPLTGAMAGMATPLGPIGALIGGGIGASMNRNTDADAEAQRIKDKAERRFDIETAMMSQDAKSKTDDNNWRRRFRDAWIGA